MCTCTQIDLAERRQPDRLVQLVKKGTRPGSPPASFAQLATVQVAEPRPPVPLTLTLRPRFNLHERVPLVTQIVAKTDTLASQWVDWIMTRFGAQFVCLVVLRAGNLYACTYLLSFPCCVFDFDVVECKCSSVERCLVCVLVFGEPRTR